MRNGIYLFLCMLFLVLVLGGCTGTRHSFQTTPTPLAYEYETQELYAKRDENRIYGVVYVPQNVGEKMPAVIFAHGFGGNYQVGTQYAEALAAKGYVVYCFDFCGFGCRIWSLCVPEKSISVLYVFDILFCVL